MQFVMKTKSSHGNFDTFLWIEATIGLQRGKDRHCVAGAHL